MRRKNILHVRERGLNGCAGAFYIGEKTAMDEGYENIILADDDCFPVSNNLLKKIVHALESGKKLVLPYTMYGRKFFRYDVVHHYGGFSREVFEKSGMTYFPLGFGGEDLELKNRIEKNGFKVFRISARAEHRTDMPMVIERESLARCYARGGFMASILTGHYARAYFGAFFHLFSAVSYWIIGRKELGKAYLLGILDASSLSVRENTIRDTEKKAVEPKDIDVVFSHELKSHFKTVNIPHSWEYSAVIASWIEKNLKTLLHFGKLLNRNILFVETYDPNYMPIMTLSKNSYMRFNNRIYRIDKEKTVAHSLLGYLLQNLSLLPIAILSFLLVLRAMANKKLKKAETQGYGI